VFSTAEDNQSAVDIHLLQGERTAATDNISLGRFRLDGIPSAARGTPQVEVTFDMDANGILNVTAKDQASGREQRVTITASTNLSRSDIDRMVDEAKQHEADDARQRELVEARNLADNLIYQIEKALNEKGAAVTSDLRGEAESAVNQLRQAATGNETNRIRSLTEQAHQILSRIQQTGAGAPSDNGHHVDQTPEGEVVEGDFKDA
jgi:molecular chaperone DnaK